jgi:hypothetical protein
MQSLLVFSPVQGGVPEGRRGSITYNYCFHHLKLSLFQEGVPRSGEGVHIKLLHSSTPRHYVTLPLLGGVPIKLVLV